MLEVKASHPIGCRCGVVRGVRRRDTERRGVWDRRHCGLQRRDDQLLRYRPGSWIRRRLRGFHTVPAAVGVERCVPRRKVGGRWPWRGWMGGGTD